MRFAFVAVAFILASTFSAGSALAILGPAGEAIDGAVQSSADAGFTFVSGLTGGQGPAADAIVQSTVDSSRAQGEAAVIVADSIAANALTAGAAVMGSSPAGSPDELGVACALAPGPNAALDCFIAHIQALTA